MRTFPDLELRDHAGNTRKLSSLVAGAYLGSWGGYTARRAAVEATGLSDPVVAVGEDVLAVGLAALAVR